VAHFLYRLSLKRTALLTEGPSAAEQTTLGRHLGYLQDLAARGSLVLAGRTLTTGPETFGIAILAAESEEDARAIMRADPAVSEGLMTAELFPYRIAVMGRVSDGEAMTKA
jgi:uncharacterized protein